MTRSNPRGPGHRSKRPTRRQRSQAQRTAQQNASAANAVHQPDGVRLQKVLADAGLGSRRACEQLIADARVEVDGQIVTELGTRIDPETQTVHVDSMRIVTAPDRVYLAFNKPAGVVSTMDDPEGRPSLAEYLRDRPERLFHVGRLDAETEGLLLITNDGELSNRLTHPSYEISKTYLAQVRGPVAKDVGARLREGIELDDGIARVDSFKLIDSTPGRALVELVLHEGRNRIVRRLLDAVGNPVDRLVRTHFGPIALAEQRQGKVRDLRPDEIGELMQAVGL
ncbi:pseudouridine synthase [Brevibacterium luteolum]|uniref:pseudouridine synthase n=1 Tax=Brevibacterium luteolum TaxID=199591 RepID=UPI00223B3969|nr:pseudouridine synthase [Brevibacterium luteolum]MCT1872778.1 rRNA pseudouridine synthase [Brevibacterium luteolum]MCT1890292.1 rRNA pseudouridine synthase [Brevibacterium luteolum]MCT1891894.1 rRNA pseudouridine synthase [Brevibacterium luteolum]MCT1923435.1 rRNA pseudouridine synthase [Brevibacterium luteolum]